MARIKNITPGDKPARIGTNPRNSRVVKPDSDPLLDDILALLEKDGRSNYAKAMVSGLSSSTLKSWQMGRVRRPQALSLQMAARMLGYKLAFIEDRA